MDVDTTNNKKENKEDIVADKFESKYAFVLKFADSWFDLLDTLKKSYNLDDFIREITGYTLIGENVGSIDNQHIRFYDTNHLVFFAMVNNNLKDICVNLEISYSIFKKYGLSFCPYTKIGPFNDINSFQKAIREVYLYVLKSPVETEGEGSVLYISAIDSNDKEKIVSVCKLKTLEYRIFRKIREKLKVIVKEKSKLLDNLDITKNYKKLIKEIDELLGEETSAKLNIQCYIDFALYAFNHYEKFMEKYHIFLQFAQFLNEIKKEFELKNNPLKIQSIDTNDNNKISIVTDEVVIKKNKISEIGKLNVIIVFGLVGCGKSSVYKIIEEFSNKEFPNLNVFTASSDNYRASLVNEYMKANSKASFDKAFECTGKNIAKKFMTHVESKIDEFYNYDKENFLYFDKNINPETIDNTIKYN